MHVVLVAAVEHHAAQRARVHEPVREVFGLHVILRVGLLSVRLLAERAHEGVPVGRRVDALLDVGLQEGRVVGNKA